MAARSNVGGNPGCAGERLGGLSHVEAACVGGDL